MTDNEYLAYIAGIFDGEGTVTLIQRSNAPLKAPRVQIAQKGQQAFFEELVARWGGCIVKRPGADSWQLNSVGPIKRFLTDILPYLRFKRSRAIIVLTVCEHCQELGHRMTEENKLSRIVLERKFNEIVPPGGIV